MKYFIVIEDGSWADEFDLSGYQLVQAETEDAALQVCADGYDIDDPDEYPIELYFGTNESQTYSNKNELMQDIEIKEITEQEYNVISKVLGDSFGVTAIL